MDDKPKKKPKMIPVVILKASGDNAMVEFTLDKIFQRATIPTNIIEDGKVPEDELRFGIPYGVPWEIVPLSASSIETANQLRKMGIWTADDAMRNPNVIIAALQAVYGVDLAALIKFARENK